MEQTWVKGVGPQLCPFWGLGNQRPAKIRVIPHFSLDDLCLYANLPRMRARHVEEEGGGGAMKARVADPPSLQPPQGFGSTSRFGRQVEDGEDVLFAKRKES